MQPRTVDPLYQREGVIYLGGCSLLLLNWMFFVAKLKFQPIAGLSILNSVCSI